MSRKAAPKPARAQAVRRSLSLPLAAALLAVICLIAYWNSFRAQFLLDNHTILLEDPRLRAVSWQNLHDIFAQHYWWPSFSSNLYRPLTTLSYWFNYAVMGNGADPGGYHAVNLLLHWINATLAFALVRAITRKPWLSLVVAAVFAVHPLTVESVTNVVGRADLLAAMSVLGGLLLYRHAQASTGRARVLSLIALGATYCAGVFCKESAVVLPALMLLHDLAVPLARVWMSYLAVVPGVVALTWARWSLFHAATRFGEFGSDNPIAIAPFWTGVMTAVKVCGYYLARVVWPAALSSDYSYNEIPLFGGTFASGQDLHAWLALAALIALAVAAIVAWQRLRAAAFFLGVAAIAFLPTANIVMPIGTIMADRLMYLPLLGLVAAAALAIAAIAARASTTSGADWNDLAIGWTVGAAIVIAALGARTIARNEDWTSGLRLWTASAEAAPNSIKVLRGLALSTMASDPQGGRVDDAIAIASRGLQILDAHPLPLEHTPAALFVDLGHYHARKADVLDAVGNTAQAASERQQSLGLLKRAEAIDRAINAKIRASQQARGIAADQIHDTGLPLIYRNLAAAYLAAGNPQEAVATLTYLERLQPLSDDAHYTRGVAEGALAASAKDHGDMPHAMAVLGDSAVSLIAAVLLNPRNDAAWQTLAQVYGLLAPTPEAIETIDGRPRLNMNHPLVAQHVKLAGARLVRQLDESGLSAEAERWRQQLTPDASPATRR